MQKSPFTENILPERENTISFAINREMKLLAQTVHHSLNFFKTNSPVPISENIINGVELAITEGLTNAIKQPPVKINKESGDKIKIELSINESILKISIFDFGEGFDITKTREPNFATHPESGYGIFLIRKVMDSVDYVCSQDRNALIMEKSILYPLQIASDEGLHILIVDDDDYLRAILSRYLSKLGHTVIEADNASTAFELLVQNKIPMVISDWIMPGENGIEFCKKLRKYGFSYYIYFILLTSKNTQEDIIEGLDAGADDFIKKPFNKEELKVKIRSGERVINLEKDLADKNLNLQQANRKIEEAYLRMRQDLEMAAKFQIKLLPETNIQISDNLNFEWIFLPSDFVAGDLFNYFQINDNYTAFYLFDVSGHGVSSAMLSFTLNRELFPNRNSSNLIFNTNADGEITNI
ncbi:MAG: response regulator, partial [Spirochaetia bacterium]|nr:response regulator [Spirochaetia bacterium]